MPKFTPLLGDLLVRQKFAGSMEKRWYVLLESPKYFSVRPPIFVVFFSINSELALFLLEILSNTCYILKFNSYICYHSNYDIVPLEESKISVTSWDWNIIFISRQFGCQALEWHNCGRIVPPEWQVCATIEAGLCHSSGTIMPLERHNCATIVPQLCHNCATIVQIGRAHVWTPVTH